MRPDVQCAYIEVTNRCNLNCAMCVRQSWRDPQGSMSTQTFQEVLAGLRDFPALNRVVFGGFGEPLMHPNIVEMVSQVHSLGVGVTITTNALLLKRPLAEALLKAGADTIVVSLDSMHIQAYQRAKVNGGLNRVLENIQGVHELIRDSGWKLPALGLEYVAFRANVRDFRFPSCVDCGMDCTYAQENSDCWGNNPSCADCLWAQGILHCP